MRQCCRAIIRKDDQLLVMKRNKFGHEYYALIGGGIDIGETPEQSLIREVKEETSLDVTSYRLVYIEDAGEIYGIQYIFVCEYSGSEPALDPKSEEAKIHAMGSNLYEPVWLPIAQLADKPLLPAELKQRLVEDLANGFPDQPVHFQANVL